MYLRKRGKIWYFSFYVKDERGKSRLIERAGGRTKAEAERNGRRLLRDTVDRTDYYSDNRTMLFCDFLESVFLPEYVEVFLRPATQRTYRAAIRLHIIPELGGLPLIRVNARTVQRFVNALASKYSRSTTSTMLHVVSRAMRYAKNPCGFIDFDACVGVSIPPSTEAPKRMEPFSPNQIETLFSCFPTGHDFYAPMVLSYYTGMRQGECLALKWEDVDLEHKEIYIHATMFDDGGAGVYQPMPKTRASVRTIVISDTLADILRSVRRLQAERKLAAGKFYRDSGYVCTNGIGKNLTASRMRYFNQVCRKKFGAGSFHTLRHTHATMLLESGVELELVSKRLGHANINTTAGIYSHITKRRSDALRSALDTVFG